MPFNESQALTTRPIEMTKPQRDAALDAVRKMLARPDEINTGMIDLLEQAETALSQAF